MCACLLMFELLITILPSFLLFFLKYYSKSDKWSMSKMSIVRNVLWSLTAKSSENFTACKAADNEVNFVTLRRSEFVHLWQIFLYSVLINTWEKLCVNRILLSGRFMSIVSFYFLVGATSSGLSLQQLVKEI